MNQLFKVISQSNPVEINTKAGSTQKSTLVLQDLGGKYENAYVASLLGNQIQFSEGDIVWAALRFSVREHNDALYQDIVVKEIGLVH